METFDRATLFICLVLLSHDAFCDAQSNKVRLVGGSSATEGRVEVFYNREWGTVCDDNFDDKDAAVICSMLGFTKMNAKAKQRAFFGQGTGRIWMDELRCRDADIDLFSCQQSALGSHNCGHSEDAGVVCAISAASNIRLAGGGNPMEGRVEVYYNNQWGTVCDDSWDTRDASVVCFMLGYSRENAIPNLSASFGQGTGQIWMDDVLCEGTERDLFDCKKPPIGRHNCGHSEDAGVTCSLEGSVRLVGGSSPLEGRVEIHSSGSWGTVCDDSWDNTDAAVVCFMLGFLRGGAVARTGGYFQSGVGNILLDEVNCIGTERSILQCLHAGLLSADCGHHEDAGVTCKGVQSAGILRGKHLIIVNGNNPVLANLS
eukprot:XP_011423171.1 PREDICTED: neurotrypsin [Crassostrea gigas]